MHSASRFGTWFNRDGWRQTIIAVPYGWLIVFFFLPFIIVVGMSLAMRTPTSPPVGYQDAWPYVVFENYHRLVSESIYVRAYATSIWNAFVATILCLLVGYPMALGLMVLSAMSGRYGTVRWWL